MKRSGFTMVELIFVIVIIGILAATALPKFSGVRDRAKVNSELSAMSGLDGAITAQIEFHKSDFGNKDIDWYLVGNDANATSRTNIETALKLANTNKTVLGKVAKKTRQLKVVAQSAQTESGRHNWANGVLYFTPVIITGTASDSQTGVAATAIDVPGKPDKNDFWIFNPSSYDMNITGTNINPTVIDAGTIGLVDVNGTQAARYDGSVRYSNTGAMSTPASGYFGAL